MQSPRHSREIRVFLSSTFRDMESERDYLMSRVFPQVRQLCAERRAGFTEIDLRWGITEEQSRQGHTVAVCLDEIDRCREYPPFFIGFLGERYGWIPSPNDLAAGHMEGDAPYAQEIRQALQQGISVTELEMQYAFLGKREGVEPSHAKIFLRAPALTEQLCDKEIAALDAAKNIENTYYDNATGSKLERLKDALRASPCLAIDGYSTVEQFGEAVKAFLIEAVERLFPAAAQPSPAQLRNQAHAVYAASRCKAYVRLEQTHAAVLAAVRSTAAPQRLAIVAPSGRGKSAFLADLAERLEQDGQCWVFAHYTGADGDRSLGGWADRLAAALQAEGGRLKDQGKIFSDLPATAQPKDLWDALPLALHEIHRGLRQPLYLLVDAVNQFDDAQAALSQLQALRLPPGVALVITLTNQADAAHWACFDLPPLTPALRQEAIGRFYQGYRKTLANTLQNQIADHPATAEPLFLRLLLEELRMHAQHEKLGELTEQLLATGNAGRLFTHVLAEIDQDFAAHSHRTGLAAQTAGLMTVSRRGLLRHDLACLLASANDPQSADGRHCVPDATLSPLLAQLEPFCLNDGGRRYIMHDALRNELLGRPAQAVAGQRLQLVDYFTGDAGDAVAERLHQHRALGNRAQLAATLAHLPAALSVGEVANALLRDVLGELGAGSVETSQECRDIGAGWVACIQRWTKPGEFPVELTELNARLHVWAYWILTGQINEAACTWWKNHQSGHELNVASWLNQLATLLKNLGSHDEAESRYREALALMHAAQPNDIAGTLNNLAELLRTRARYEEAESLYRRALTIRSDVLPAGDPDIAPSLNGLAVLLQQTHRIGEAETLYRKALDLQQRALPIGHPHIAGSLNNLAALMLASSRFDEAEPLFRETLSIQRNALPPGHPDIAGSLNNMAMLLQATGRTDEAEPLFREALAMRQISLPAKHPDIATSLGNLARCLQKTNRPEEAEALYREALDLRSAILDESHPDIVADIKNLAGLLCATGRTAEAEPLFRKERLLSDQLKLIRMLIDVAASFNDEATRLAASNRTEEAEGLFREALQIRRDTLPKGHPDIAVSLYNLAGLLQATDRIDEAVQLHREALALRRSTLPAKLPDVVASLSILALLLQITGCADEAESLYREALTWQRSVRYVGPPDLADNLNNLALLLRANGRIDEANQLFQEADEINVVR